MNSLKTNISFWSNIESYVCLFLRLWLERQKKSPINSFWHNICPKLDLIVTMMNWRLFVAFCCWTSFFSSWRNFGLWKMETLYGIPMLEYFRDCPEICGLQFDFDVINKWSFTLKAFRCWSLETFSKAKSFYNSSFHFRVSLICKTLQCKVFILLSKDRNLKIILNWLDNYFISYFVTKYFNVESLAIE